MVRTGFDFGGWDGGLPLQVEGLLSWCAIEFWVRIDDSIPLYIVISSPIRYIPIEHHLHDHQSFHFNHNIGFTIDRKVHLKYVGYFDLRLSELVLSGIQSEMSQFNFLLHYSFHS